MTLQKIVHVSMGYFLIIFEVKRFYKELKSLLFMPDRSLNHYLVISGHISSNKKKEFEQTFRLAFGTLSADCLEYGLSADTIKEGYYHFFSLWLNENAMKSFMDSMEFQLMNGAFHALGSVKKTFNGNVLENHQYYSGL